MSNCRKIRCKCDILIREAHTPTCFTTGGESRSCLVPVEKNKSDKASTEMRRKSGYNCRSIEEAGKYYRGIDRYNSSRTFLRDVKELHTMKSSQFNYCV